MAGNRSGMDETNADALLTFTKALSDKAPNSIKEVAKVLLDMTTKFTGAMNDLRVELKNLDSSNSAIKAELTSVKMSMGFINTSFEEFKEEIKSLRQELTEVKKENIEHQKENKKLSSELKEIRKELTELKQYGRRNNVELKGVPVAENENMRDTIEKVAKCLSIAHSDHDIDAAHRVPTKGSTPPNIVVRFVSRTSRDNFLRAAKKHRLNSSMLGFEDNTPVYVNEHLCPENKVLLGKAIQAKREKNWKFAWVADGKILMRKSENSRVLHVSCVEDLNKVN